MCNINVILIENGSLSRCQLQNVPERRNLGMAKSPKPAPPAAAVLERCGFLRNWNREPKGPRGLRGLSDSRTGYYLALADVFLGPAAHETGHTPEADLNEASTAPVAEGQSDPAEVDSTTGEPIVVDRYATNPVTKAVKSARPVRKGFSKPRKPSLAKPRALSIPKPPKSPAKPKPPRQALPGPPKSAKHPKLRVPRPPRLAPRKRPATRKAR